MPTSAYTADLTHSPHSRLQPTPIQSVKLMDQFWAPRLAANRERAIPRLFALLEAHGVLDNFRRLTGRHAGPRRGFRFSDSDLYKWLEAAALAQAGGPDAAIAALIETALDAVLPAQQPDGYLNTYYVDERAGGRWTDLENSHEMYCAGHLMQAGVAHASVAGDQRLLRTALRFADLLDQTFRLGGRPETDGHPEVELALVALYRATRERRYLGLARHFLDGRGVLGRSEIWGHAVRAGYFMSGVMDVYLETGDPAYLAVATSQWQDMLTRKAYVTGGVGGRNVGESFGEPYELPNERAYAETCAASAVIFWAQRMLHATGEAAYTDWLERVLYNGFLAGVSLAGTKYFYENPLADSGQGEDDPWYRWARRPPRQRREWYDCTCCPPNVQRLLAALPGYFYSASADGLWVHLFGQSTLHGRLQDGLPVKIDQATDYPWEGQVRLTVTPEAERDFTLHLRIPGWAETAAVIVDGRPIAEEIIPGRYLALRRAWRPGSVVGLEMGLAAQRLVSDERVAGNRNSVAVQRGPLIYCLEGADHAGTDVRDLRLPDEAALTPRLEPELLNGVTVLEAAGLQVVRDEARPLYRRLGQPGETWTPAPLRFIPYYAWANRGPNAMTVWVRR